MATNLIEDPDLGVQTMYGYRFDPQEKRDPESGSEIIKKPLRKAYIVLDQHGAYIRWYARMKEKCLSEEKNRFVSTLDLIKGLKQIK